ncbi:MAG: ornithine cyclodeaminase family protein [Bryobacteraceae bacterium]
MPLWLTESDVRAALAPAELIDAMECALRALSAGEVAQPVRTAIEIGDRSFFAVMPAFDRERAILGAKLVSVAPANQKLGIPTHLAAISLLDATNGELLAVADGRYITEVRTAAVSAVSVRHLARADARVLAILGSGVQARSHLEVVPLVRAFGEIRVWSPTAAHRERFAAQAGVRAASSAEEAVRGADVIVLATNSVTPAIDNRWVEDGAHVISIGACRVSQREIDPALMARAALFVDSREAALAESGDVVQSIAEGRFGPEHIRGELGEVIAGRAAGRTSAGEVTVFKSLGQAIEDLVAADLAYRRSVAAGLGIRLTLT